MDVSHLTLEENKLTGTIPQELGNLKNLKNLWLHNNQLKGQIPSHSTVSPILCENLIQGYIPSAFANLTSLSCLWTTA